MNLNRPKSLYSSLFTLNRALFMRSLDAWWSMPLIHSNLGIHMYTRACVNNTRDTAFTLPFTLIYNLIWGKFWGHAVGDCHHGTYGIPSNSFASSPVRPCPWVSSASLLRSSAWPLTVEIYQFTGIYMYIWFLKSNPHKSMVRFLNGRVS